MNNILTKTKEYLIKNRRATAAVFLFSALVLLRFFYYGAAYFPQLDDYIQYIKFGQESDVSGLIESIGLLSARPLSGLLDVFLWSRISMTVSLVIMALLFVLSALMLRRVFARWFGTGYLFCVLLLLSPLGFEGTYWLSASTRIICGCFFLALSAVNLTAYFDTRKKSRAVMFAVFQLICFGFYEQMLVLSITLTVIMLFLEHIYKNKKQSFYLLFCTLGSAVLYFLITGLLASGDLFSSRGTLASMSVYDFITVQIPNAVKQIGYVFTKGLYGTAVRGFVRGISIVVSGTAIQSAVWTVITAALCVLLFLFVYRGKTGGDKTGRHTLCAVICGLLLAAAPSAPFFVLSNPWFSFRNAVPCFPGLALAADALIMRALYGKRALTASLCSMLALISCVCSVSELHDYRETYENDSAALRAVYGVICEEELRGDDMRIGVLGMLPSYLEEQNIYYHEHIHGVTESSWAFTGAVEALSGRRDIPELTPLAEGVMYESWNRDACLISGFDRLIIYCAQSGCAYPVTVKQTGNESYEFYLEDGTLCASSADNGVYGYLTIFIY